MTYDPKKDTYEYDENLSLEENHMNMSARMSYLYDRAKELHSYYDCHWSGCEARAQYLESRLYDDDLEGMDEMDGWDFVEGHLEDYAMKDIMDSWVERGTIYPESKVYGGNGYEWMLESAGWDIPGVMEYVKNWCDNTLDGKWYEKMDELKAIIAKDYYDMWEEV